MPELVTKIIDLFFEDTNKGESEQDKVDKQIEVVNIDDKDQSIMDEFFNFALFEREKELLFIEQTHSHSTMQQSDTENEEWFIDDIIK
ncbi:20170_t:CDS:1, partial [Gigaspora margarita]